MDKRIVRSKVGVRSPQPQDSARLIGHIDVFRGVAGRLSKHLQDVKGPADQIDRLFQWLREVNEVESSLGVISGLLANLDNLLDGLLGPRKKGRFGSGGKGNGAPAFGGFESTLADFLDQTDRLERLLDAFDTSDENTKTAQPGGGGAPHGTSIKRGDGASIVTTREIDKDGHETEIRGTFFDDGGFQLTTTTHDYDGHGGTRVETFDGDHVSTREYDQGGRAVRKEDFSLRETVRSVRESVEPAVHDDEHGGTHSPTEDGSTGNTGQLPAEVLKRLGRVRDGLTSFSMVLRTFLGDTAHPDRNDVDPNTGLSPLDGGFAPGFTSGPSHDSDRPIDPNTGLDLLHNIDLSRVHTQTGPQDDVGINDPNTGLNVPPGRPSPTG